jgi:uncharacterized protein
MPQLLREVLLQRRAANAYKFHGAINETYELSCELERKRVECAIMIKAAEAEKDEISREPG